MRKNQITISVMEIVGDKPLEYSVYCDSDNFYEALSGAIHQVFEEKRKRDNLPTFGDKSVKYKPCYGEYQGIPIIKGDVLSADADVIVHQVNCRAKMGSGVAKQIRERFPIVYKEYLSLCTSCKDRDKLLGTVQYVDIGDGRTIANMFSQLDYGNDGKKYTNVNAFAKCLKSISERFDGKRVALPYKIGCCRGGADWNEIFALISTKLRNCKVSLYLYEE